MLRRAHMLRGARSSGGGERVRHDARRGAARSITYTQHYLLAHIARKRSRPIDDIGSGDQSRAETQESDLEWLALA